MKRLWKHIDPMKSQRRRGKKIGREGRQQNQELRFAHLPAGLSAKFSGRCVSTGRHRGEIKQIVRQTIRRQQRNQDQDEVNEMIAEMVSERLFCEMVEELHSQDRALQRSKGPDFEQEGSCYEDGEPWLGAAYGFAG